MKIPKICKLENSKNFQFGQCQKFSTKYPISEKFPIWKIPNLVNLENSKNLQFVTFKKLSIWKIEKRLNSEKFRKFPILKILKISNLINSKFAILKIPKIPEFSYFENHQISEMVHLRKTEILVILIRNFVLLIFEISKFLNMGRSKFDYSKC